MNLSDLLDLMIVSNASDLHLSADNPPLLRVDGSIIPQEMPNLSSGEIHNMLREIMNDNQIKDIDANNEVDFAYSFDSKARFRVNVFKHRQGLGAVLRLIPAKIYTLDDLNLGKTFRDLCNKARGLVLITGPTGSGKSTTLAAMIDYINENHDYHILTIEDPIEFVHTRKKSLINQREVHQHTNSFSNALRAALREDPDIILVGELRDLETIRLALSAAETGHLVFGTLHTTSAVKTIDRIIDVFPNDEKEMVRTMLSESLEGVIAQILLKKTRGGRVAAHEIMLGNQAVRNLIRENKGAQIYSIMQTSSREGMITLDNSLKQLRDDGLITTSTALPYIKDLTSF